MSKKSFLKSALRTQLEDSLICGTTFFNKDTEQERVTRLRLHKLICTKCREANKNEYFNPNQVQNIVVNIPDADKGERGSRFMVRNYNVKVTTKIELLQTR
jgi:hypothetical protein